MHWGAPEVTEWLYLGRDKERYVRSLAEDVECHLNANDLRPSRLQQLQQWNNTAQRTRQGAACPFALDANPQSPGEAPET